MAEVIVIGAGMAGLIAALRLAEEGISTILVEARNRVGGRIHTEHIADCNVELGAEFVHGKPQETFTLLDRFSLGHYELDGDNLVYDGKGNIRPQHEGSAEDESPFPLLETMTEWSDLHPNHDLTFSEWLAQQQVSTAAADGATGFVEGFNAADASIIGVRGLAIQQHAEDEIDGDLAFHLQDGYAALPEAIAAELLQRRVQIILGAEVRRVTWEGGSVKVTLRDGRSLPADRCILTLPLGVLQSRRVEFQPEIDDVLQHADKLRMGSALRVSLLFQRRWWAELDHPAHRHLQQLSFLLPQKRSPEDHTPRFEVFWTPNPDRQPMITAWAGGTAAYRLRNLHEDEIANIALRSLEQIFQLTPGTLQSELVTFRTHNWQKDPLACGAYSYVPVNAFESVEALALPHGEVLIFAGEHTDTTGHWGTVHGAIRSGIRAARQATASLRQK